MVTLHETLVTSYNSGDFSLRYNMSEVLLSLYTCVKLGIQWQAACICLWYSLMFRSLLPWASHRTSKYVLWMSMIRILLIHVTSRRSQLTWSGLWRCVTTASVLLCWGVVHKGRPQRGREGGWLRCGQGGGGVWQHADVRNSVLHKGLRCFLSPLQWRLWLY